jgi:cellulose synthase operon protein C
MPALFFPERDTLRQVLTGGGIPSTVSAAPARAGFDDQGRLWLSTSAWLSRETLVVLTRYGVRVQGAGGAPASEAVTCWHELVPLEAVLPTPEQFAGPVLFEAPGAAFTALAGEIERLGAHSYSYHWSQDLDGDAADDRVLIKTTAPPFVTLLHVLDESTRSNNVSAFVEQAPGIWVAAGYRLPLAALIQRPAGKLLFVRPPRRWEWRPDRTFSAPVSLNNPDNKATANEITAAPGTASLQVPIQLRLLPALDDAPAEMWLVRDDAEAWLEQFVRSSEDRFLSRFSFAMTDGEGPPCLVLRLRGGKEPAPVLVGVPRGYRTMLKLPNLWAPCGFRLVPTPRRDSLRTLLAPDPKRITWLRPLVGGSFQTESLPVTAFQPLKEWVNYIVEQPCLHAESWSPSSDWEFERFAVQAPRLESERAGGAKQPAPNEPAKPVKPAAARKRGLITRALGLFKGSRADEKPSAQTPAAQRPVIPGETSQTNSRLPRDGSFAATTRSQKARERINSLKSTFLQGLTKSAADRHSFWPEFADAFAEANDPAEAAICRLNALWDQEKPEPNGVRDWLLAEASQAGWSVLDIRIGDWLNEEPRPPRIRAVAAYAVWATLQEPLPATFTQHLPAVQSYLEANENELPLRAAWLARTALARLTRGDVLALAQTRDRLLSRLHRDGQSLDLDMPAFIRFGESNDADRLDLVRKWLIDKQRLIHQWIERLGPDSAASGTSIGPFGLEAEVRGTQGYADLMLAWALARLGEKIEGARLRDRAWLTLGDTDAIHTWLKLAFDFRIRQAREGRTSGGALPNELLSRLEAMPDYDRYRVDRLRQHSRILDSTEHINAFWASTLRHYRHWDEWRKKLIDLPSLAPAPLNDCVKQLLAKSAAENKVLPVVMFYLLDVGGRLDRDLGEQVLQRVPTALDLLSETSAMRLRLLEKSLLFAASFDRPSAVQPLVQRFVGFVERQRGLPASERLEGLTSQTFRCLRRLGLKREAYDILGQVHVYLTGGQDIPEVKKRRPDDWPGLMRTLLHIASAYNYCGQEDLGFRIIDPISKDLFDGSMSTTERTALALTYASVLGNLKVPVALGRFTELFQRLKEISVNGWNSHYTRQPLELIDTVLLAIVSDDFTLGPAIRGWLDDDEYLVRQRIHKDLQELMRQQGV